MYNFSNFINVDVLRNLISASTGALAVGLRSRSALYGRPIRERGLRRLSWTRSIRATAVLFLPFCVFMVFLAAHAAGSQRALAFVVAVTFLCLALYLAYCVFLVDVHWTGNGIGASHPLGRKRFVRWDDVVDGGYVGWLQAFYVSDGEQRVWFSPMHSGVDQLHRFMRRRFARNVADRDRLERAGRCWYGFEFEGSGLIASGADGDMPVGYAVVAWAYAADEGTARAAALSHIIEAEAEVFRATAKTVRTSSSFGYSSVTPDLPIVGDGLRRPGFVIYRDQVH